VRVQTSSTLHAPREARRAHNAETIPRFNGMDGACASPLMGQVCPAGCCSCSGPFVALRFIRRSAASYLLLRQKRSWRGPIDTIPDRRSARPAPPWRDPGRLCSVGHPGFVAFAPVAPTIPMTVPRAITSAAVEPVTVPAKVPACWHSQPPSRSVPLWSHDGAG
jgi:hypothetical protein